MAETLTFDNTTEQTSADTLTTEEQDSLQVGEQIQQQEEQLLAGKYENAQQLEKAYIELQKKMGSGDKNETEDSTEAETETEEAPEEPQIEITPAIEAITKASEEFEKTGELSAETLNKFSEMSSKDLVDTYFSMFDTAQELGYTEAPGNDLTDSQVNSIQNSVGGEAQYKQLLTWANDNVNPDSLKSFDRLVAKGDAGSIQMAIDGIKAQYDNAQGYEGRMLTGKAPQSSGDIYRSQAEVVKAMSHPDYDSDPAYRQDVQEKLARSDVQF
jgi:hypothetical protein